MKKMYVLIPLFFLFCIPFSISACSDAGETPLLAPATLIYMVADNNLDYYAMLNINQMERGLPDDTYGYGPVFVFLTRRIGATPSHPYLMKIIQNKEGSIVSSPIIRTYRQQNTVNPNFMRQVIADVKEHSKQHNSQLRRLILWSHGTGWLPEGTPFNEIDIENTEVLNKNSFHSFGVDETGYGDGMPHNREMCIKDLAKALEGERFELVIMDACFMGTIEVAYELRHITDYFIMSPAEIVSSGFPYEEIITCLAAPVIEPLVIAVRFFNYYNNLRGALQTATVSVIETRYLEDLANLMASVYLDFKPHIERIPIEIYKQYDRTTSNYFFDFKDFVIRVSEHTQNDYSHVLNLYDRVLPFYLRTSRIFDMLDISGTSGLSIYIPNTYELRGELHEFYQSLSWTQDSNAILLFN